MEFQQGIVSRDNFPSIWCQECRCKFSTGDTIYTLTTMIDIHYCPMCYEKYQHEKYLKDDDLTCAIDGNCLSIVKRDFINLAESPSVFIELTKDQIEKIKKLENGDLD